MTKRLRAEKRLSAYGAKLKRIKLRQSLVYKRFIKEMKILEDSGRLRGSVTPREESNASIIGSSLSYARIHQLGGVAPEGNVVPARPYLGLSPQGQRDVVAIIQTFLNNAAKAAGKGG